jgi:hypothetical protein
MAMTLIKKTENYKIYLRGDKRYAVQDSSGKPVNGEEKVRILIEEDLIKVAVPTEAPAEEAVVEQAPAAEEAPAEEPAEEEAPAEEPAEEEAPAEEPAEEEAPAEEASEDDAEADKD